MILQDLYTYLMIHYILHSNLYIPHCICGAIKLIVRLLELSSTLLDELFPSAEIILISYAPPLNPSIKYVSLEKTFVKTEPFGYVMLIVYGAENSFEGITSIIPLLLHISS